MNCENFETVIDSLAREKMMDAATRQEAVAHTRDCRRCEVRLREEERLTKALRALARETAAAEISNEIEERLRLAYRSQLTTSPRTKVGQASYYWLTAAAAVLLLASGLALINWRHTQSKAPLNLANDSKRPAKVEAVAANSPLPAPLPQKNSNLIAGRSSPTRRFVAVQSRLANRRAVRKESLKEVAVKAPQNNESEISTDFLPVGYDATLNLQEGGRIVRVELPRSTLAAFGLPVNMDRYNEKLKADVLYGADGLARAVRFVQ